MLAALLSSDNTLRSTAEQRYETLKREQPQALVSLLFQALLESKLAEPVREQAAVLLRQLLNKGGVDIVALAQLLQLFEAESVDKVRRKVGDIIYTVGNRIIDIDEDDRPSNVQHWPELLPTLMRIITDASKLAAVRADALWIVKEMACSIWQVLVASSEQTLQLFKFCFADASEQVRAQAACLLCGLVAYISSKESRKPLLALLPDFFNVITQLAGSQDVQLLKNVLSAIILANEDTADFFKDCLASHFLPMLCNLSRSHKDEDVRKQALEALCCAMEGKPKMMLKVPKCLDAIFEICALFMVELDDAVDSWIAAESNEEKDGEDLHDIGAEVIDRICGKLKEVEMFPQALGALSPAIAQLLQRSEWKQVVAGLAMMKQIIEYVDEGVLDQMLQAVRSQLQASHPRIRNTAWGCVQQFAMHQEGAAASDEWVSKLMPDFISGLDDTCPRNVEACMEAFHHYGEHVDREAMELVLGPLMNKLGEKLKAPQLAVRRESITCIAVVAQQVQDSFAQYYAPLMPVMKSIIGQTLHSVEERRLLGKAFECVSLLANAVGRDAFRPDAEAIMESMLRATQVPDLPQDDPVKEYMMAAAERICSTLRDDFVPFLPHFLPLVLSKLQLTPKEYDSSDPLNASIDTDNCSVAVVAGDDGEAKLMLMNSSELEDVQNAVECVHTFVEKLGVKYMPFVADTAKALLPVFEFSMREEIRDMAFETWGQLCHSAREAGQASLVSDLVKEFMNRILPKLELPIVDPEAATTQADGVKACLKEAGPDLLSGEQVQHITSVAVKLVKDSFERSRKRKAVPKDSTAAEDDDDTDDEDDGEEQLLRQAANNIATAIMSHHPDIFVNQGLSQYLSLVQNLLVPGRPDEDRQLCHYILSSFGEHLAHRVVPHWGAFLPQLLQDVAHENSKIRISACYAASFFAREKEFAPVALEVAGKLAEVISKTRARGKKKSEKAAQMAADNALSALMEILLHHEASLQAVKMQMWGTWIAGLPCQEDSDEGTRNHGTLVQLVQKEKVEVVGANGEHIPQLLSILVDVYRTDMVDDVANWGIGQLLKGVGESRLEQYAGKFSEKQKKKLIRAVRDAQRIAVPQ